MRWSDEGERRTALEAAAPAMLSDLKAVVAFLEDEVICGNDYFGEHTCVGHARALSDRIAATIKLAEGEV